MVPSLSSIEQASLKDGLLDLARLDNTTLGSSEDTMPCIASWITRAGCGRARAGEASGWRDLVLRVMAAALSFQNQPGIRLCRAAPPYSGEPGLAVTGADGLNLGWAGQSGQHG